MERYARQAVFSHIGKKGQEKLLKSKVTIIGMGALGTVAANNLCRAGVGHIRMADRDYVELTNLQRQILYNEDDVKQRLPKVIAASKNLSKVNPEIILEPVIADVNSSNIEGLVSDVDLVLDATDNFEIRLLINEACCKHKIPWIYCGALGGEGITMNILPERNNPCLRCILDGADSLETLSCSMFGVLNMLTGTMASIQTAEAIKILLNSSSVRKAIFTLDLWENRFYTLEIEKNDDCPVCVHGKHEYLGKVSGSYTTDLCGSNSIQVTPSKAANVDFHAMAERLKRIGSVNYSNYSLIFSDDKYEIMVFQDGRAIIKNAIDGNNAKSIYTEYIGL